MNRDRRNAFSNIISVAPRIIAMASVCLIPQMAISQDASEKMGRDKIAQEKMVDDDSPKRGDPDWLLPMPGLQPDPKIPSSKDVLRYDWGVDISDSFRIETYLRKLSNAAPKRSRFVRYGTTHEGRPLHYLVISSPRNIDRIDEIKSLGEVLADPKLPAAEHARIMDDFPVIVWLACAVHGNEISTSEAAMLSAYHLLADQRESMAAMLEKVVVVIDPLQNPDGRDRFVNVYRETRGVFPQSHATANEHTERWPNGRTNHYWFDMNRDWFRQSQIETQAKVAAYLQWQPQIYIDAHEMGANSSFYFPPPADPKNPLILPSQLNWFGKLGRHQAGWFDRYGFGYMTREVYDAFYPGYGSEWPTLQGGLGVLWEQASARGKIIDRNDDTQLTYRDGIRNNYVSALSTIEFAAAHRRELLQHFHRARVKAVREGSEGDLQHYFLRRDRPHRSADLAVMLGRNGIRVDVLTEPLQAETKNVRTGERSVSTLRAGTFHIPLAQPCSRLIEALLSRNIDMDETFLRKQLERNQLRLPDEIYDVTAWSVPLAFDVECHAAGQIDSIRSEPWRPDALGQPETIPPATIPPAKVAYLIPGTDGAVRLAANLLQQDVRLHVADESFVLGGRTYDPGTLIAKVADNDDKLLGRLRDAAAKFDVQVVPTDTAYVDRGAHMGGQKVRYVKPPKVLLVVHQPTNYSSGHTWHLFDQLLAYPTTRVNGGNFASVDLDAFNTIVLPDGNYVDHRNFAKSTRDKIQAWVRGGGTLITLRGATAWAASEPIGLIKNQVLKRKIPKASKASKKSSNASDEAFLEVTPDNVSGAFFRADVFGQHWVTYQYRPKFDVFYSGNLILGPTPENEGRSLVTFGTVIVGDETIGNETSGNDTSGNDTSGNGQDLLSSGFCWPENLGLLSGSPYAVHRSIGAGHIVAFVDDPNFRAMYPSLQRLFINAAMFGASH
ncbi:MAG: M14 family zinc carboxypeptidase [Planctomycetota bacterium]